jgi:hypothetical protein
MDDVRRLELQLQRARKKENDTVRKQYLDGLAARDEEIRKKQEAENEKERQRREAQLKLECAHRFATAGGSEQEFEKQWPQIRAEYLKQQALGNGPKSFVDELVSRKRAGGTYGR